MIHISKILEAPRYKEIISKQKEIKQNEEINKPTKQVYEKIRDNKHLQ